MRLLNWLRERKPTRKHVLDAVFVVINVSIFMAFLWYIMDAVDYAQAQGEIRRCKDWSAGLDPDLALDLPDCPAIADLTYEPTQGLVCTCPPKEE